MENTVSIYSQEPRPTITAAIDSSGSYHWAMITVQQPYIDAVSSTPRLRFTLHSEARPDLIAFFRAARDALTEALDKVTDTLLTVEEAPRNE